MSHKGFILCMNVSGSAEWDNNSDTNPSTEPDLKTKRFRKPKKEEAHDAVVAAVASCQKRYKVAPGIILLQEYSWATKGAGLASLADRVSKEVSGSESLWAYFRQWDEGSAGQRDTVVLFNTTMYENRGGITIARFLRETNGKRFDGNWPPEPEIKLYTKRWAGGHLRCIQESDVTGQELDFLVVSYHGRSNRTKRDSISGLKGTNKLKDPIKCVLSQDFVIEVSKACKVTTVRPGLTGVPGLIGGDWNCDRTLPFSNWNGLPGWTCTAPRPIIDLETSVRVEADGSFKEELDYFVAVNILSSGAAEGEKKPGVSCELVIEKAVTLPHAEEHEQQRLFDHDPLLASFIVRSTGVVGSQGAVLEGKVKGGHTLRQSDSSSDVEKPIPGVATYTTAVDDTSKRKKAEDKKSKPAAVAAGKAKKPVLKQLSGEMSKKAAAAASAVKGGAKKMVKSVSLTMGRKESFGNGPGGDRKFDLGASAEEYRIQTRLKEAVYAMLRQALNIPEEKNLVWSKVLKPSWWTSDLDAAENYRKLDKVQLPELYENLRQKMLVNMPHLASYPDPITDYNGDNAAVSPSNSDNISVDVNGLSSGGQPKKVQKAKKKVEVNGTVNGEPPIAATDKVKPRRSSRNAAKKSGKAESDNPLSGFIGFMGRFLGGGGAAGSRRQPN